MREQKVRGWLKDTGLKLGTGCCLPPVIFIATGQYREIGMGLGDRGFTALCSRWPEPSLGNPTPKERQSISQKIQRLVGETHRICSRLQNSLWAVAAISRYYCLELPLASS